MNGEKQLQDLLKEVLAKRNQLEDKYEIAAILESNGWNDQRAAQEFGAENVFAIATDLWHINQKGTPLDAINTPRKQKLGAYLLVLFQSFLKGTVFAVPMAISVFSMLTLRFSLWSFENFSVEIATSIATGTILSFMAIGGFTQAIARRGFLYVKLGYYNMARQFIFVFVKIGFVVCLIFALAFLFFNMFFGMFSLKMTLIIVVYFFFLSAIWLSVTIMYILEKELVFTLLLVAGIGVVYILYIVWGLNIILSQIIALIIIAASALLVATYLFNVAEKKMEKGIEPSPPRISIIIYTVIPYFIYGFFYFTFLFLDRVIAWSASSSYMPYLIWFRGPYELGLDLALIALIIPMGFVEAVVNDCMLRLESIQKEYLGNNVRALSENFRKMYTKRVKIVVVFSFINSLTIYGILCFMNYTSAFSVHTSFLDNKTTHFVLICALLAYTILTIALMNSLILFSFSQPDKVVNSLLYGLFVNMLVGFPLSRWFDHSFAVLGLLAGVIVFTLLTLRQVKVVLNKIDYYLYSAS